MKGRCYREQLPTEAQQPLRVRLSANVVLSLMIWYLQTGLKSVAISSESIITV
jgi:hypothetical protein